MPLPAYYSELYVAICRDDDSRVVGSGLCYNGERIITCAHVVNSALNCDQTDLTDKTGKQIKLRFSQSTLLNAKKIYSAKVIQWFPSFDAETLTLKKDLAVLVLEDVTAQEVLQLPANELRFVADDVNNNQLFCISHNTMDADEDAFIVTGTIQPYQAAEGKSQINMSNNVKDAFFRPGSSGSPVFSETLNGISGIIDQRVDDHTNATFAFMIDARRIGVLLDDIIVHTPSLQKKSREAKKFLCDRKQVVEDITTARTNPSSRGNFFFLSGNHKQEGYDFRKRYEQQFLPSNDTIFITIDLPVEVPALFKSRFYEAMSQSARNSSKSIQLKAGDDILTCYKSLKGARNKGFFFRINDFDPENAAGYEWFVNDFLKPGKIEYPNDLHILIMYEYLDSDATIAASNREFLLKLFGVQAAFSLDNVTQKDIHRWISLFEESTSHPFKMKLLELLDQDKDYPMLDIFRQYEKAKKEIPDHEKL